MRKNNAGFSVVETVIAAVLVSAVAALVLPTFVTASRWSAPTASWGFNLAQSQLAMLHEAPDALKWDEQNATNPLSYGSHQMMGDPAAMVVNGRVYKGKYVVPSGGIDRNGDGVEDYRKVISIASWDK